MEWFVLQFKWESNKHMIWVVLGWVEEKFYEHQNESFKSIQNFVFEAPEFQFFAPKS